ncbi:MAG: CHAD domain-containing protein [Novosphingobium sp.]
MEVELKLDLGDASAEAIRQSNLLPGETTSVRQSSTYYDTPDRALLQAGLSLRLRRTPGQCIQTIKAVGGSAAGLFTRAEWEQAVDGQHPVLAETDPIATLLGAATSDLAPVFEIEVDRRIWRVNEGEAEIELVMDRGAASSGDDRVSICEVELELARGPVAALFALARKLDEVAPVRLGVRTKAERGYGLSPRKRRPFKAEPVVLAHGMNAAEAFQRSAQACIRHFRLNEDLVLDDRAAGAGPLHQARVALRRLRSAFSIYRPLLDGDPVGERLREELRWLSGQLGEARNLDVLIERGEPGALQERLLAERSAAYGRVTAALGSPRVRAMMLDLAEWLIAGEWLSNAETQARRSQPAREFAAARLDRLRRRLKKDGDSLDSDGDEARHEVRKDAKRLRYAAEFFGGLFDRKRERRRYKAFIADLEDLQDRLGALNDLATAPEVLRGLGIADNPEAALLLVDANKPALVKAAAKAHAALVDAKRFWR